MNEIIKKFLLAGDKFMSKMHLRQPGFTYNACGPITKTKKKYKTFKKARDSRHIYQNEFDKGCFQHNTVSGDFIDLPRRTASYQLLLDEAFNIAKNLKYDGYKKGPALTVYKCFNKRSSSSEAKREKVKPAIS